MDSEPKLAVSGNMIYLSYLRMPSSMDRASLAALAPEEQMLRYAGAQQLVIGRLDPETLAFVEERVFEGEGYLHSYTMSADDDSVTVAWFDSELTDAASVLAQTDSVLCTATLTGEEWSEPEAVANVSGDVGDIILGKRDGETLVAYTVNQPLDTENLDAMASLYVIGNDGTAKCVTDECAGKVTFARIPSSEQSDFVWNDNDMLVNAAGETVQIVGINESYVIVGDAIYYSASDDASGDLTSMQYIDGAWTSAIEMIEDDAYLEDLSVVVVDGKTYVLGMNTTVTIGEDDILNDAKDMVFTQLSSVSDLVLGDVLCDRSSLVAGQDTTVSLYVFNAGDHTVTSVDILVDGKLIDTREIEIPFNSDAEIPVTIRCPFEETTYTFEVRETGVKQHCKGKNVNSITLGYADFTVELTKRVYENG